MLEDSQLGLREEAAALFSEFVLLQFDPVEGVTVYSCEVLATFRCDFVADWVNKGVPKLSVSRYGHWFLAMCWQPLSDILFLAGYRQNYIG